MRASSVIQTRVTASSPSGYQPIVRLNTTTCDRISDFFTQRNIELNICRIYKKALIIKMFI